MNEGGISAIAQGYENLGKGTMAQKGLDLNRTWSNKINTDTQSGFLYGIWEAFVYEIGSGILLLISQKGEAECILMK